MQHTLLQDFLMECVDQRLQLYAARADCRASIKMRERAWRQRERA
jgi:hypothetical protein